MIDPPTEDVYEIKLAVSFTWITDEESDFSVEHNKPTPDEIANFVRSLSMQQLTEVLQQAGFPARITTVEVIDADHH